MTTFRLFLSPCCSLLIHCRTICLLLSLQTNNTANHLHFAKPFSQKAPLKLAQSRVENWGENGRRWENMICDVGGKLASSEKWPPKNQRVGGECASRGQDALSRWIMSAAEVKRLQFTCPPTGGVHVGECERAFGGGGLKKRAAFLTGG